MSYLQKIIQPFADYSKQTSILIVIISYLIFTNEPSILEYFAIGFICILLVSWTTINNVQEKIPEQPLSYLFAGIFLTQLLTYARITVNYSPSDAFGNLFVVSFSLIAGFIIWHILMVIIAGLITSTTDISFDIDKNIDDPYGDKHAARILNESNE